MLSRSATYNSIFATQHSVEWKIVIDGTTYGMGDISADLGGGHSLPKLNRCLFTGSTPTIGGCCAATFECSIFEESANIPRMATVVPSYRISNGTLTSEWIQLGVFYIDTRSYDKAAGALSLYCYDAMLKADGINGQTYAELSSFDEWPQSMADVVDDIADIMGVEVDSRTSIHTGDGYNVNYTNDLTMREVLGYIAVAHCGNWCITPAGKLRLVPITGGSESLNLGSNAVVLKSSDELAAYSGVTVYGDDGSAYDAGTDSGMTIVADCPWATQDTADGMLSDIRGYHYQPYTIQGAFPDLALELGDFVTAGLPDDTVTGPCFSINITCEVLETAEISAPGEAEVDHEYPYTNYVDRSLKRKVGLGQAYYGVTISRQNGLEIKRSDGASEVIFNSDLFTMRALVNGVMQDRIYFDPIRGDYVFDGSLGDLTAQIAQYIDSNAGTAKIIAACSGTYQTIADMSGYVTSTSLNSRIGQYIDTHAGTAKIVAACEGTFQTINDMANYVQNSSLDASIGAYIDGNAGTAKVIQACEGTYQTVAGMTGYVTS